MDEQYKIPSEAEVLAFFAYAKGRLQAEFPQATYVNFTASAMREDFVAGVRHGFNPNDLFTANVDSLEQAIVQLRVQIPTNQIRAMELRARAQALLGEAAKLSS